MVPLYKNESPSFQVHAWKWDPSAEGQSLTIYCTEAMHLVRTIAKTIVYRNCYIISRSCGDEKQTVSS